MRILSITTETSLRDLVDRAYADLTPQKRKQVEAALLRANPQLARGAALRPGAVAHLPDVEGAPSRPGVSSSDPPQEVLALLADAVRAYGNQLARSLRAAQAEVVEARRLAEDREVAAAIERDPEARALAAELDARLRARGAALAAEATRLPAVFEQVQQDLTALGRS